MQHAEVYRLMELVTDSRLGYHQEPHEYLYTPETIATAIAETQNNLD